MPLQEEPFQPNIFIVESILKHRRKKKNKIEYYIKWKGWGVNFNSWEPEDNILDESLIHEYWSGMTSRVKGNRSHCSSMLFVRLATNNHDVDEIKAPLKFRISVANQCVLSASDSEQGTELQPERHPPIEMSRFDSTTEAFHPLSPVLWDAIETEKCLAPSQNDIIIPLFPPPPPPPSTATHYSPSFDHGIERRKKRRHHKKHKHRRHNRSRSRMLHLQTLAGEEIDLLKTFLKTYSNTIPLISSESGPSTPQLDRSGASLYQIQSRTNDLPSLLVTIKENMECFPLPVHETPSSNALPDSIVSQVYYPSPTEIFCHTSVKQSCVKQQGDNETPMVIGSDGTEESALQIIEADCSSCHADCHEGHSMTEENQTPLENDERRNYPTTSTQPDSRATVNQFTCSELLTSSLPSGTVNSEVTNWHEHDYQEAMKPMPSPHKQSFGTSYHSNDNNLNFSNLWLTLTDLYSRQANHLSPCFTSQSVSQQLLQVYAMLLMQAQTQAIPMDLSMLPPNEAFYPSTNDQENRPPL